MKHFFSLIMLFTTAAIWSQTNTFSGVEDTNWNNGNNWSLNLIPTSLHDVIIPTGKTVNISSAATTKSIQLVGTAVLNLSSTLSILQPSSIAANATFNWAGGTLTGGGTLNNLGALNLVPASGKILAGGTIINNSGMIAITTDWSLSINDGTLNNLPLGVIDFQSPHNIVNSGVGSHLLNNQGLIKKSTGAWVSTINTDFINSGTIASQAGYLDLYGANITLNGGTYNANAGCQVRWYGTTTCTGTLTGNLVGDLVCMGDMNVTSAATFNFTDHFYWSGGNLNGGGILTNSGQIIIASTGAKNINDGTVLNNSGHLNFTTDWPFNISNGTLNNPASGIIDFQSPGSGIGSGAGSLHTLNNAGLIKKTGTGNASIAVDMVNTGTIASEVGILELNDADIVLNNGIYNVSQNADLRFQSTVTASGTLTGNLAGAILWIGNVNVPGTATLNFSPNSNFNWFSGSLIGGGTLRNNSTFYYASSGVKSINGGTTLNNAAQMNFTSDWELQLINGTINNLVSGTIDLQTAVHIIRNGSGTHAMNNAGLIKKTASTGTAQLYTDLTNTGIIESSFGTIAFDNLINSQTGTVTGNAAIQLATPTGSLTNNGTFAPGGSPGSMLFFGNYTSTNNTRLAIEINGLTQGTQYDFLNIQGNAILKGVVNVTLGFAPVIGNQFIVAATTGTITECTLAATTTAMFGNLQYTFNVVCIDDNKVVLTLASILAANNFAFDDTLKLYPNPASDSINVQNESGKTLTHISISDLSGRNVMQFKPQNGTLQKIDLGNLSSGTYIVKITSGNDTAVKKIIVE